MNPEIRTLLLLLAILASVIFTASVGHTQGNWYPDYLYYDMGDVVAYDIDTGEALNEYPNVYAFGYNENTKLLYLCNSAASTFTVYDGSGRMVCKIYPGFRIYTDAVSLYDVHGESDAGQRSLDGYGSLLANSEDGSVWAFRDEQSKNSLKLLCFDGAEVCEYDYECDSEIQRACCANDGRYVALLTPTEIIVLYTASVKTNSADANVFECGDYGSELTEVEFSHDSNYMAVVLPNKNHADIYSTTNWSVVSTFEGIPDSSILFTFGADSTYYAASSGGNVKIVDLETDTPVVDLEYDEDEYFVWGLSSCASAVIIGERKKPADIGISDPYIYTLPDMLQLDFGYFMNEYLLSAAITYDIGDELLAAEGDGKLLINNKVDKSRVYVFHTIGTDVDRLIYDPDPGILFVLWKNEWD